MQNITKIDILRILNLQYYIKFYISLDDVRCVVIVVPTYSTYSSPILKTNSTLSFFSFLSIYVSVQYYSPVYLNIFCQLMREHHVYLLDFVPIWTWIGYLYRTWIGCLYHTLKDILQWYGILLVWVWLMGAPQSVYSNCTDQVDLASIIILPTFFW